MKADIAIMNNGTVLYPPVLDGIAVEWQRRGAAGKMVFEMAIDPALSFEEGDRVQLQIDGKNMFLGFIHRFERTKERKWAVVAHDSTWYLIQNKDTFNYQNKTATQLIRMIAEDYQLSCGQLDESGFVIKSRCEQDTSLMDIILNALDEVLTNAKQMYVLYDDNGQLTLKNVEAMRLDLLIDEETAEDYKFASNLENGVHNRIRIVHEDTEAGVRSIYTAQDSGNIAKWGVLQLTDKVQTRSTARAKAEALLSLHNRPMRTFSIQNALGDTRVRGGSLLPCIIDLGPYKVMQHLMAESVKHKFDDNRHLMDLKLRGGMFGV